MLPMWLPHNLPLRSCINFKYILFASSSIISILCHSSLLHHHQTFLFAPAQWYVNVHDSFPYWFLKLKKKKKNQINRRGFCWIWVFLFLLLISFWFLFGLDPKQTLHYFAYSNYLDSSFSSLSFFFNCISCFSR